MKYEDIVNILNKLNEICEEENPFEMGLPMYGGLEQQMVKLLAEHFNVTVEEDPRIHAIMLHTACSREAAQNLIDSGTI